jgi:hypothetical protein
MSGCPEDPTKVLAEWLQNACAATLFTGAGMSTESGATHGVPFEMLEIIGNSGFG